MEKLVRCSRDRDQSVGAPDVDGGVIRAEERHVPDKTTSLAATDGDLRPGNDASAYSRPLRGR